MTAQTKPKVMNSITVQQILGLVKEDKFSEAVEKCELYVKSQKSTTSPKIYSVNVMKGFCLFNLCKLVESATIYENSIEFFETINTNNALIPIEAYEGLSSVYESQLEKKLDQSKCEKLSSIYDMILHYMKTNNEEKYVKYFIKKTKLALKLMDTETLIENFTEFYQNYSDDDSKSTVTQLYQQLVKDLLSKFNGYFYSQNNVVIGQQSMGLWLKIYDLIMNYYKWIHQLDTTENNQNKKNNNRDCLSAAHDSLKMCINMLKYLNKMYLGVNIESLKVKNIPCHSDNDTDNNINTNLHSLMEQLTIDKLNKKQQIESYTSLVVNRLYEAIHIFYNDFPNDNLVLEIMNIYEMKSFLLKLNANLILKHPSTVLDTSFFKRYIHLHDLSRTTASSMRYFANCMESICSQNLPEINNVELPPADISIKSSEYFYVECAYLTILFHCCDYNRFIEQYAFFTKRIQNNFFMDCREKNELNNQLILMNILIMLKMGYIEEAENLLLNNDKFIKELDEWCKEDFNVCQIILQILKRDFPLAKEMISNITSSPLMKDYVNLLWLFQSQSMDKDGPMTSVVDYLNKNFHPFLNINDSELFYCHSMNFLNEQLALYLLTSTEVQAYDEFLIEMMKDSPNSLTLCFCVGQMFYRDPALTKMALQCYYRAYSLGYLHRLHIKTVVDAFVHYKLWDLAIKIFTSCEHNQFFLKDQPWIHRTLAHIYLQKKELTLAIHRLTRLTEIGSTYIDDLVCLTETFIKNNSFSRAIQIAEEILTHDNSNQSSIIYANILLAKTYYRMGSYQQAINHFETIREMDQLSRNDKIQCEFGILECYLCLSKLRFSQKNIHQARNRIINALDISFKLIDGCHDNSKIQLAIAEAHVHCVIVASQLYLNYHAKHKDGSTNVEDSNVKIMTPMDLAEEAINVAENIICSQHPTCSHIRWMLARSYLNALDISTTDSNNNIQPEKIDKYRNDCLEQLIMSILLNNENILAWNDLGCYLYQCDADIRLSSSVFLVGFSLSQKEEFMSNAGCNLAHCYLTHHALKTAETLYDSVLTVCYKNVGAWLGKYLLSQYSNVQQTTETKYQCFGYLMSAISLGFHKEASILALKSALDIIHIEMVSKNDIFSDNNFIIDIMDNKHITSERLNSVINDIDAYLELQPRAENVRFNSLLLKTLMLGPAETYLLVQKLDSSHLTLDLTILVFYLCFFIKEGSLMISNFEKNAKRESIEISHVRCIVFAMNFYKCQMYDKAKYYFERALELMPNYHQNYNSNGLQLKCLIWLCDCRLNNSNSNDHVGDLIKSHGVDLKSNCGTVSVVVLYVMTSLVYNNMNYSHDLFLNLVSFVNNSENKFNQFYSSLPLFYLFKKTRKYKDLISLFMVNLQKFPKSEITQQIVASSLLFLKNSKLSSQVDHILTSSPKLNVHKSLSQIIILSDTFENWDHSYNRVVSFLHRNVTELTPATTILVWLMKVAIKSLQHFHHYFNNLKEYFLRAFKNTLAIDRTDETIGYFTLLLIQCCIINRDYDLVLYFMDWLENSKIDCPLVKITRIYVDVCCGSETEKLSQQLSELVNFIMSKYSSLTNTARFDIYSLAALIEKKLNNANNALLYYKRALALQNTSPAHQRFVLFSVVELASLEKSQSTISQACKALNSIKNSWPEDEPTINYITLFLKSITNDDSHLKDHLDCVLSANGYVDSTLVKACKHKFSGKINKSKS